MTGPRRRRAGANIRPDEIRGSGRDVREGLDWLGKPPAIKAGIAYRLARGLARGLLIGVFGCRVDARGREHLPPGGGYILLAALHRGWMDPFLALDAVPAEPRVWTLGSGPSGFDRPWKERALRIIGGVLPVWRGGVGIEVHVTAARAVLERGGVFSTFVEGTIGGPPNRPTPFRVGAFVIAMRTDAPIVPLAVAGAEELYRGKRFATRILPPTTMAELVGEAWSGAPEPGSREEIAVARRAAEALEALLAPVIAEIHPATVDPPTRRRRWPWLTGLLLGRPKA
ncbi:MAG: lysophospholipid acyltransferase family protein [Chloroflexota bacterium]